MKCSLKKPVIGKLMQTPKYSAQNTKHLDLGCGDNPRNPYNQAGLYGIDICDLNYEVPFVYTKCNIFLSGLPYESNFFDSVSAFDFIEHIPRELFENEMIRFPFIDVMNEIYRVLKPNGRFYALTPAYPKESAFVDPTHINIITKDTHTFFTEPEYRARRYGFNGSFAVLRAQWCHFRREVEKMSVVNYMVIPIKCFFFPKHKQHFLWEFRALK